MNKLEREEVMKVLGIAVLKGAILGALGSSLLILICEKGLGL